MPAHWSDTIVERYSPCDEAVTWMRTQPNFAAAWSACERGDWMLWLAHQVHGFTRDTHEGRALLHARADCAASVLHIYEAKYPGDTRVRDCIQALRDYADGKISAEELDAKRSAARAYAAAAYAAAAYAADAAAYAADADADAAYAAAYAAAAYAAYAAKAADAADAAAKAADAYAAAAAAAAKAADADAAYAAAKAAYAAYIAARAQKLRECADLIRARIPTLAEVAEMIAKAGGAK